MKHQLERPWFKLRLIKGNHGLFHIKYTVLKQIFKPIQKPVKNQLSQATAPPKKLYPH